MTDRERVIGRAKQIAMRKDLLIFDEIRTVFVYLCSMAVNWNDAANTHSIREISEGTGLTKYRVRKVINVLRDLEVVEKNSVGFPGYEIYTENGLVDFDEPHPPKNGFGLTEKGYKSNTYRFFYKLNHYELALMCSIDCE